MAMPPAPMVPPHPAPPGSSQSRGAPPPPGMPPPPMGMPPRAPYGPPMGRLLSVKLLFQTKPCETTDKRTDFL